MIESEKTNQPSTGLSRRDFFRTGLGAGAGLVLSRAASAAQAGAAGTEDLNVAIIGTGAQGRVLIDACLNIPYVKFKAVCDIWRYSRRYGERYLGKNGHKVNAYEDYRELLEKEKDLHAVIVATPDFVHHEHANAAMEAGLDVYCEKLMSNSVEKARSMVQTRDRTGRKLQIGHHRRSNPRYQHALQHIVRGEKLLGRVTAINGQWNRAVSEDLGWPERYAMTPEQLAKYGYANMHEFRNWRWFRKYGGGPISDLGAHQIDIYNWMLKSNPVGVIAGGGVDFYDSHEWYDNVMAILEYPTPEGLVRAFYEVLTTTSAGGGYYEYFMGTEGSLKMSENPKITRVYAEARAPDWRPYIEKGIVKPAGADGKGYKPWEKPKSTKVDVRETAELAAYEIPVTLKGAIHQPHLENFFQAVMNDVPLNCPAEEGFASAVTILKINEAVAAQKRLTYNPQEFTA